MKTNCEGRMIDIGIHIFDKGDGYLSGNINDLDELKQTEYFGLVLEDDRIVLELNNIQWGKVIDYGETGILFINWQTENWTNRLARS